MYCRTLEGKCCLAGNLRPKDTHCAELSPGMCVTITVTDYSTSAKLDVDVDLTPALEFDGWPKEARHKRPGWIRVKTWENARKSFHLVPKCHSSGE